MQARETDAYLLFMRAQIRIPSASMARGGDARIAAPAKARHSGPTHACARQLSEEACQSPEGCAPVTGSVAGYGFRPASGESCAVWLLLLLLCGCELAAVGAGISAGEGGASSRLRRAAFSSWRLLAVRSHSSSFPARASARASLAAKESAH